MSRLQVALVVAYILLGAIAAAYIAGAAYFIASKAIPRHIEIDTWLRYWDAYSDDPIQRKRLLIAAVGALLIVLGIPLFAIAAMARNGRSLHGDARWASHGEIRKAGLL